MTFMVSDSDGFEVISVVIDKLQRFTPHLGTGTTMDASFFWDALPDDFEDLPVADREYIEEAWKGLMMYASSSLAEIAHLDQASGIIDFPLSVQRKWLHYELERTQDLVGLNLNLKTNLAGIRGGRLLYGGESASETYLELTQGGKHVGAWVALGGPHTERATVRMELRCRFAAPSLQNTITALDTSTLGLPSLASEVWFFVGYGDLSKDRLAPGIYAAVSTRGRVATAHRVAGGPVNWEISANTVSAVANGEQVFIRLYYAGLTDAEPGSLLVEVESVSDSADIAQVSTEVDTSFRATQVVLTCPDTRVAPEDDFLGIYDSGAGKQLAVVLDELAYLDVSVHPKTRRIPLLQPRISDDSDILIQDIDFEVAWVFSDLEKSAAIHFREQPEPVLWAEITGLDDRRLEKTFGRLISDGVVAKGPDTEKFKNRLFGLLYGLTAGPHPGPLAAAIGSLGGVPIALRPGVVVSTVGPSGDPAITIREFDTERVYPYPGILRPKVAVGDTVEQLQVLVEGPVVQDWTSGRGFVSSVVDPTREGFLSHEVEKYSAFLVDLPYGMDGAFEEDEGPASLPNQIREYLYKAQAVWVGTFRIFLRLVARLEDFITLSDYHRYEGLFTIRDALTLALDPRYNDGRGFYYDQPDLIYNSAELEVLRDRLVVRAFNDGTLVDSSFHPTLPDDPVYSVGAVSPVIFGNTVLIPLNDTAFEAEYESVPTTPWDP